MGERWYLIKLVTNMQDQSSNTVDGTYFDHEAVLVAYHNILAAYHNAPDVKYAIVEIQNQFGNTEIKEIVDHIPAPEPEPEEEPIEEL